MGFHGTPLSAQLSSRNVCTVRNSRLDGTPLSAQLSSRNVCTVRNSRLDGTPLPHKQQKYSDCSSLTSVFERILVDYLPKSATDYSEHAMFDREWAWPT